jgi:hypothetical protein
MSYNPLNPNGQASAANSSPVTLSNENVQDLYVTGQANQTALSNNVLLAVAGTSSNDLTGYRSASVQLICPAGTYTTGAVIFEGSNDNINFQAIPVWNQNILTGTPITSAITLVTTTSLVYTFSVTTRYVRCRISTGVTGAGASVQAFSKFSQTSWTPTIFQIAQATAANLNVTATIGSGTVTTVGAVTNSNRALPTQITDVASAAITTTTTTATLTPTNGCSYWVEIPVTVVSGTTPTMDVQVQESDDGGTNWYAVYDFPRITATGAYRSPKMPFRGNRVRYVQTIAGTTPSFTRAINRLQSSDSVADIKQMIDRTIVLTALSSVTPSLNVQDCRNLMLSINIGAVVTTPPTIQLQGSDDYGATWYNIGSTLLSVASSTVQTTVSNINSYFVRAIVTNAGVGVTAGYVLVKGF